MKRLPKETPTKALVLATMAVAILAACSSANIPERTPNLAEACKEYADAVSALAPQRGALTAEQVQRADQLDADVYSSCNPEPIPKGGNPNTAHRPALGAMRVTNATDQVMVMMGCQSPAPPASCPGRASRRIF